MVEAAPEAGGGGGGGGAAEEKKEEAKAEEEEEEEDDVSACSPFICKPVSHCCTGKPWLDSQCEPEVMPHACSSLAAALSYPSASTRCSASGFKGPLFWLGARSHCWEWCATVAPVPCISAVGACQFSVLLTLCRTWASLFLTECMGTWRAAHTSRGSFVLDMHCEQPLQNMLIAYSRKKLPMCGPLEKGVRL